MALATMAYLEWRYAALEKEIADALRHRPTDDRAIDDLSYRKLIVADEIQHQSSIGRAFQQARRSLKAIPKAAYLLPATAGHGADRG
jgi:hypothetical protein